MNRIKQYRELMDISLADLASVSGINEEQLRLFETDDCAFNKAKASVLVMLSKIFGCTPEELLGE